MCCWGEVVQENKAQWILRRADSILKTRNRPRHQSPTAVLIQLDFGQLDNQA